MDPGEDAYCAVCAAPFYYDEEWDIPGWEDVPSRYKVSAMSWLGKAYAIAHNEESSGQNDNGCFIVGQSETIEIEGVGLSPELPLLLLD